MTAADPVEIFQTSTMAALLDGVYEGNVSIRELLRHGDFGLGTVSSRRWVWRYHGRWPRRWCGQALRWCPSPVTADSCSAHKNWRQQPDSN